MQTQRRRGCRWLALLSAGLAACFATGGLDARSADLDVSGTFAGLIEITPAPSFDAERFLFGLSVRGDGWLTSLRATMFDGDFSYLGFSDYRQLGPVSLRSILAFDPSAGEFSYFSNLSRIRVEGIGFANYIYYPRLQDQAYDQITVDGASGAFRWRAAVRASLCDLAFDSANLRADWECLPCRLLFGTSLSFERDTGFESARVTMSYRELPYLTFGSLTTDFVMTIDWGLDEKTVSPELRTRSVRTAVCLTPLFEFELGAEPLSLDGVSAYGIRLEASLEDAIEFYAGTSFAEARNAELTGFADYFEVFGLRVRRPACCGADHLIEVAFYFSVDSPWAFDIGMLTAGVEIPLAARGRWVLEMDYPADADWAIRIGWEWDF